MSWDAVLIGTLIELLVMLTFASASTVVMLGLIHCFFKEGEHDTTEIAD